MFGNHINLLPDELGEASHEKNITLNSNLGVTHYQS